MSPKPIADDCAMTATYASSKPAAKYLRNTASCLRYPVYVLVRRWAVVLSISSLASILLALVWGDRHIIGRKKRAPESEVALSRRSPSRERRRQTANWQTCDV